MWVKGAELLTNTRQTRWTGVKTEKERMNTKMQQKPVWKPGIEWIKWKIGTNWVLPNSNFRPSSSHRQQTTLDGRLGLAVSLIINHLSSVSLSVYRSVLTSLRWQVYSFYLRRCMAVLTCNKTCWNKRTTWPPFSHDVSIILLLFLYFKCHVKQLLLLFRECCSRCRSQPYDCVIIRFVESTSASWSRFSPPSNCVDGHVSTMWFMVCRWPQSQEGDWARSHLCKLARHGPWPVRKR